MSPENKPPVILQVLPSLKSGGVERGTIEITRAIVQAGGKALVASSGGPMASQVVSAGGTHITLKLMKRTPWGIYVNSKKLERIIREHHVDIIHARSRAPAWSAWLAAKRTGCRFMTTFHGVYGLKNRCKRYYNSIMTRGERVIAISQFIADHIKLNYIVDPSRIRVIHRGVDRKFFHPAIHSPNRMIALSREWHLPDHLPLILFPGRITRWKGQHVFLKALATLPHRNFFAVILGDDKGHKTYRAELETLIHSSDLSGNVRILEHTNQIAEAYMLSKLVVATSIDPEAFGRVVLEAQAMGKPVITTNHGGPCETVIDGVTGWLVPPGDIPALTAAIDHGLNLSDADLKTIGDHGSQNAQNFTTEVMCQNTLQVYLELLTQ